MNNVFDFSEIVKRVIKYMIEGIVVAIVAYAIVPKHRLNLEEVAVIALSAMATFSILDVFIPAMGASARSGTGLAIGFNLAGFPHV